MGDFKRSRQNKRVLGRSIEERPAEVEQREEFDHWEIDTVIGKKSQDETLMTLTERKTRKEFIFKITGKDCESIHAVIVDLQQKYGSKFSQIFKTLTADNDPSVVPIFLVLTGLLSVQIIFGLFGYKVLKSIGYFREFVDIKGSGKSPGSYSLICPGVAFTVMGMFFVHYGFVRTGIIEQFSTVYFLLLAPFWYVQLKTITTIFALNKKLLKSQEPQAVLKEVKSL